MARSARAWTRGAVLAAAALVAVALPGLAYADAALPDNTVVTGTTNQTYTYNTTTGYWSIVALQPPTGTDVDLTLRSADGVTTWGTSLFGGGRTDFVAVNSNAGFQPLAGYRATTSLFSGPNNYAIQQIQGRTIITLPTPANDGVSGPSDPDITFAVLSNDKVASISDIYLTAGQKFWSTTPDAGTYLYLLESNPSSSATFFRSRSQAGTAVHSTVDGCTLYTATYTGWHALAVVGDRSPAAPGAGIAFALHQFNPAKPTSCPVKNFPAPTPA